MQHQTRRPLQRCVRLPIQMIAHQRIADPAHMNTNLMRASGEGFEQHQAATLMMAQAASGGARLDTFAVL